jgi:hypothetical protein
MLDDWKKLIRTKYPDSPAPETPQDIIIQGQELCRQCTLLKYLNLPTKTPDDAVQEFLTENPLYHVEQWRDGLYKYKFIVEKGDIRHERLVMLSELGNDKADMYQFAKRILEIGKQEIELVEN